ncbi:hypothetical protein NDU88_000335 [Pleurodeles waltl]|uniref:Uncharacterized protein n=1 Tax=Pleurodeles waltl TaxID=8319 RepID=A0AAV7U3D5_PLEWA|nr:hypothetical protein NDU88_000335 [Pleurodeles waltl]
MEAAAARARSRQLVLQGKGATSARAPLRRKLLGRGAPPQPRPPPRFRPHWDPIAAWRIASPSLPRHSKRAVMTRPPTSPGPLFSLLHASSRAHSAPGGCRVLTPASHTLTPLATARERLQDIFV